jgi:hypothetical protein
MLWKNLSKLFNAMEKFFEQFPWYGKNFFANFHAMEKFRCNRASSVPPAPLLRSFRTKRGFGRKDAMRARPIYCATMW